MCPPPLLFQLIWCCFLSLVNSERGMPSSREALYWAIRTQCTVLGVRPSEEVFAFVVNLLIESSM